MPMVGLAIGGVDFSEFFAVLSEGDPTGPYATLAAAQEAGAVTVNWGIFVNSLITFLIVAFALFMVIKGFNKMKREEEEAPEPEAPPEPTAEETLLTEIRDLLRAKA
jgi:large conductance mechanosensitive channel